VLMILSDGCALGDDDAIANRRGSEGHHCSKLNRSIIQLEGRLQQRSITTNLETVAAVKKCLAVASGCPSATRLKVPYDPTGSGYGAESDHTC
jgi:hypothetical protein